MNDNKPAAPPQPHPEPLPPAEHEKAVKQAERQKENRDGTPKPDEDMLPQTHTSGN